MKNVRTLLLLLSCLLPLPAFAQWQVPDHAIPVGRGGGAIGFKAIPAGPNGSLLQSQGTGADPAYTTFPAAMLGLCGTEFAFPVYNSGAWKCSTSAAPLAAVLNGTFNINPLAQSLQQGIVISQTTPPSGSIPGPYFANTILGTWESTLTGGGGPGGPRTMHLLNLQLYVGGPNYDTQSSSAFSAVVHHVLNDTSPGDMVGGGFFVDSVAVRTAGNIYGSTAGFRCSTGCSLNLAAGTENDTFIEGTGSVNYRLGFNSWTGGSKNANIVDSAYGIGASGGPGIARWKKGLTVFSQGGATNNPLDDDADLIYFDYTGTVANLVNAANITVTGSVIHTPNVNLTGAGVGQFGSAVSAGGVDLLGAAGSNLNLTYNYAGVQKFAVGANPTTFYITKAGAGIASLNVDFATNLLSAPSGLTVAGNFKLNGATSGFGTFLMQSVASTPVVTFGTNSGTPAVTTSSPLAIVTATGNITCTTCVTSSGGGAISGTAPISVSAAGAVSLDAAGVTYAKIQNLGALAVMGRSANSSGVGADIQATAATDAVLRESGGAIGFGTIVTGGIANNAVTLGKLATQAANTVLVNATSGTTVPTAQAVSSCSTAASALTWTTGAGFGCNTLIAAATLAIVDDNVLAATVYPTWVASTSGNVAEKISSTKFQFSPSTGNLASTTYNGLTVTGNGTNTLNIAAGKSLVVGNTVTFTGTDSSTVAFGAGGTIGYLGTAQVWALTQTFTAAPVFSDAAGSRTALGLGTMATQAASTVAITGGTVAGLTGLGIRDTSAAFDVTLAATSSSALSAGRTLTLNMGNVAHTLAFGTTANTITFPNLASYTVITNGDTGTVTNAMLANSSLTINGTSISLGASGTVTAAAGTLTGATLAAGVTASSLTSLGTLAANLTISKSSPTFFLSKTASGQDNFIAGQTGGLNRWTITLGNNVAESGANAGSNFDFTRFNDAGTFIDSPLSINRATAAVSLSGALIVAGLPASAGAGGLNVCVDTSGNFYKKASCP